MTIIFDGFGRGLLSVCPPARLSAVLRAPSPRGSMTSRTIHVSGIPDDISDDYLSLFFESSRVSNNHEVSDVRRHKDDPSQAEVEFVKPEAVAIVLQAEHTLKNRKLLVSQYRPDIPAVSQPTRDVPERAECQYRQQKRQPYTQQLRDEQFQQHGPLPPHAWHLHPGQEDEMGCSSDRYSQQTENPQRYSPYPQHQQMGHAMMDYQGPSPGQRRHFQQQGPQPMVSDQNPTFQNEPMPQPRYHPQRGDEEQQQFPQTTTPSYNNPYMMYQPPVAAGSSSNMATPDDIHLAFRPDHQNQQQQQQEQRHRQQQQQQQRQRPKQQQQRQQEQHEEERQQQQQHGRSTGKAESLHPKCQEKISVPEGKRRFALKVLRQPGMAKLLKKEKNNLEIEGTEDVVKNTKLAVYSAVSTVEEVPLKVSPACARRLMSKEGRQYLEDEGVNVELTVKGGQTYILVLAEEKHEMETKFEVLLHSRSIKLYKDHSEFIKSDTWKQHVSSVIDKYLIAVKEENRELKIEGIKDHVIMAELDLKEKLKTHATSTRHLEVKKGIARFLKDHGRDKLHDVEKKHNVQVNTEKSGATFRVNVHGLVENLQSAESATKRVIDQVLYEKICLDKPGIRAVANSDYGKVLLAGLETTGCAIELGKPGHHSPERQHKRSGSRGRGDAGKSSGRKSSPRGAAAQGSDDEDEDVTKRRHRDKDESASRSCDAQQVYRKDNVKLFITVGDITSYRADALVNAVVGDSGSLRQSGSVAKAFLDACGHYHLQNAYSEAEKRTRGSVVLTDASKFKLSKECKVIVHLKLKPWHQESKELEKTLGECMRQACREFSPITSIAFPAIGMGGLHYPSDAVAQCFTSAVDTSASKGSKIRMTIVAYDKKAFSQLQSAFSDYHAGPSHGHHHSPAPEKSPAVQRKQSPVVFHINAWDKKTIKDVRRKMEDMFEQGIMEHTIQDEAIQHLRQDQLQKVKAMRSDAVSIDIDKASGQIHISGMKEKVKETREQVEQLAVGLNIRKAAAGNKAYLVDLAEKSVRIPQYWKNFHGYSFFSTFKKQVKPVEFVDVHGDVSEDVEKLLVESWRGEDVGKGRDAANLRHRTIRVTGVQRVENPKQWMQYAEGRKKLLNKAVKFTIPRIESLKGQKPVLTTKIRINELYKNLVPEINEVMLFHGTSEENSNSIATQGFDSRLGAEGGMFGKGIYFAESATKSDQYTDAASARTAGEHKMILARVILGQTYICEQPERFSRPPCAHAGCMKQNCKTHTHFFDSVIGTRKGATNLLGSLLFREFMVYSNEQCYPEYVITYVRQ